MCQSHSIYPSLLYHLLHMWLYLGFMHSCEINCFSSVWLCNLQTVASQATLSMGFSRQEYWSGLPCLPSGDLPDPGKEPTFLTSPALAGRFFSTSVTWEYHLGFVDKFISSLFLKISLPGFLVHFSVYKTQTYKELRICWQFYEIKTYFLIRIY